MSFFFDFILHRNFFQGSEKKSSLSIYKIQQIHSFKIDLMSDFDGGYDGGDFDVTPIQNDVNFQQTSNNSQQMTLSHTTTSLLLIFFLFMVDLFINVFHFVFSSENGILFEFLPIVELNGLSFLYGLFPLFIGCCRKERIQYQYAKICVFINCVGILLIIGSIIACFLFAVLGGMNCFFLIIRFVVTYFTFILKKGNVTSSFQDVFIEEKDIDMKQYSIPKEKNDIFYNENDDEANADK